MFIDILGEVTITKDGATILRKIDVDHPAPKVLIEASNAVDNEVGDGTISVIYWLVRLQKRQRNYWIWESLQLQLSMVTRNSLDTSLEALNDLSQTCDNTDRDVMLNLARTCLQSKVLSYSGDDHITEPSSRRSMHHC